MAALVALCGAVASPPALAQDEVEYRRIFEQILEDPANAVLNLRYAKMSIDRGELRKALAAYERILERDPENREAQRGIRSIRRQLEPSLTQVTVAVGPQYETNPRRLNPDNLGRGDVALSARVNITDQRLILDERWRTEASAGVVHHATFHDVDVGTVGARTGPLLELAQGLRLYPFVGMSYTWVRRRTFATEPSAGVSLELEEAGPLKSVTARWGYDFIGTDFSSRDATFVEVFPRFVFSDVGFRQATAIVIPFWRYTGVFGSGPPGEDPRNVPFPARQHQLGVRADYFLPIVENVILGLNVTYDYRHYFERTPGEGRNRRDHVVAPGAQMIITALFTDQLDMVGGYTFEHRSSNEGAQNYVNHTVTVRWIWRF